MSEPSFDPNTPTLSDHFTILVHSFRHGLDNSMDHSNFCNRAYAGGWRSWLMVYKDGDDMLGSVGFLKKWFHPPTLAALFSELHRLECCEEYFQDICPPVGQPTAACPGDREARKACCKNLAGELWQQAHRGPKGLASLTSGPRSGGVVRLTLSLETLNLPELWQCTFPDREIGQEVTITFLLERLDAYLFPHGLGLCGIKVKLLDEICDPERRAAQQVYFWQKVRDFDPACTFTPIFFDSETLDHTTDTKPAYLWLNDLLAPLMSVAGPLAAGETPSPDRTFRFKIFGCLSLQPDTPRQGWWEETLAQGYYQGIPAADLFLYEAATTTMPGSLQEETTAAQAWQPSRQYLEQLLTHNHISIWRFWRGLALRDLVVFTIQDMPKQPGPWRYDAIFFPLYIYVYHLKLQLLRLADEINLRKLRGDEAHLSELLEEFYHLRNEYWFNEISPNFQMGILFEKFKMGLEVQGDYEAVLAEVGDIFHIQETRFNQHTTRVSGCLNRWVAVLTVGALFTGIMGMNSIVDDNNQIIEALIGSIKHATIIFSPKVLIGLLVNMGLGLVFGGLVWAFYKLLSRKRGF